MPFQMTTRLCTPLLVTLVVCVSLLVAACSKIRFPGVYRPDLQQGNVVTEEMLDQVELGMDRRKVRFILGTPLLTDPFNQDRWDYLYSLKKGSGDRVQRNISLWFENERLVRIEGDISIDPTPEGAQERKEMVVTVPAGRRKQGFLSSLVPGFFKKSPARGDDIETIPEEDSGSATVVATSSGSEPGTTEAEDEAGTISADDRADLEKLFGDFGKLYNDAGEAAVNSAPLTTRDAESP
jgi:outer membrane protein assembly factor BamE